MGKRGPAPRSVAAYRCGPHGLARKDAAAAAKAEAPRSKPLPIAPPAGLRADAATVWKARRADVTSHATRADAEVFEAYCLAVAEMRRTALVAGEDRESAKAFRSNAALVAALGKIFGLTPDSRARLPEADESKQADANEAAFAAQIR